MSSTGPDSITGIPQYGDTRPGFVLLTAENGELLSLHFDNKGMADITVEAVTTLATLAGYKFEGVKYE